MEQAHALRLAGRARRVDQRREVLAFDRRRRCRRSRADPSRAPRRPWPRGRRASSPSRRPSCRARRRSGSSSRASASRPCARAACRAAWRPRRTRTWSRESARMNAHSSAVLDGYTVVVAPPADRMPRSREQPLDAACCTGCRRAPRGGGRATSRPAAIALTRSPVWRHVIDRQLSPTGIAKRLAVRRVVHALREQLRDRGGLAGQALGSNRLGHRGRLCRNSPPLGSSVRCVRRHGGDRTRIERLARQPRRRVAGRAQRGARADRAWSAAGGRSRSESRSASRSRTCASSTRRRRYGDRVRVRVAVPETIDLDNLRLAPGDPIRLWAEHPDEPGAVRGVFERREEQSLWLMLDRAVDEVDRDYALDPEAPEVTFDRGDAAIAARAGRARRTRISRGSARSPRSRAPPRPLAAVTWEPLDDALDERQRAAVDAGAAQRRHRARVGAARHRQDAHARRDRAPARRARRARAVRRAVEHRGRQPRRSGSPTTGVARGPARPSGARVAGAGRADDRRADRARRCVRSRARVARPRACAAQDRDGGQREARARRDVAAARAETRALWSEARALDRDAAREVANAERAIVDRAEVVLATCVGCDHPILGEHDVRLRRRRRGDAGARSAAARSRSPARRSRCSPAIRTSSGRSSSAGRRSRASLGTTIFERLVATVTEHA